jgi:hypothetical protein
MDIRWLLWFGAFAASFVTTANAQPPPNLPGPTPSPRTIVLAPAQNQRTRPYRSTVEPAVELSPTVDDATA